MSSFTYNNRDEYDLNDAYAHYSLETCPEFSLINQEEKLRLWNGIGAMNAWYNRLIPNTVWGLDISLASADHDISYYYVVSIADKEKADERFLENMNKIIDTESCWGLKWIRKRRAKKYYIAVKLFGVLPGSL